MLIFSVFTKKPDNYAVKRYIAIFCFFLAALMECRGQLPQYHAQVFGEEYGLGGGLIFDVFADQKDFLWVSAPTMLQRFDGRNTRNYPFPEGLSFAFCDSEGLIWTLAGQRVWRINPKKDAFEPMPFDTAGRTYIRGIFQMKDRPVMLLTKKGLFEWRESDHHFEPLHLEIPVPRDRHQIIRIDTCGNTLFYTSDNGVSALDLVSGQSKSLPFNFDVQQIQALTPGLLILTDYLQNSYWFDFDQMNVRTMDARSYHLSPESHKMYITGMVKVNRHLFLVNTLYGLCEYDLDSDRFTPQKVYAGGVPVGEANALARIFIDHNGIAWAITTTKIMSIQRVDHALGLLRNYHLEGPEQWDNRIFGLTEDNDGNVWFGGVIGFKKLNLGSGKITIYRHKEGATDRLAYPNVRGMAWDGRYIILGPTYGGAWLFDPKTEHYRRPIYNRDSVKQKMEGDFFDYIGKMRNGDFLFCGRFYLYRMESNTYRTDFLHFPGDRDNMNTAVQDARGRVWLGTQRSVQCLDESYHYLFGVQLPGVAPVHQIFEWSPDQFLLATENGLFRFSVSDKGISEVTRVSTPFDGFAVTNIFRDSLQRMWLATHAGLFLCDANFTVFKKFDFADDIQSKVFNIGTRLRTSSGLYFMAGQNGINFFRPEAIPMEDYPLSISILSLRINDSDSALYDPVTFGLFRLPYVHNTLSFELAAPYFNNAGKLLYRYRLTESGAWIECGPLIRLPNLPSGEYRLSVAVSLNGKRWYESKEHIAFAILPPFWQTWWFLLGVVALTLALIYFWVKMQESNLRKKQARILEMEKLKNTALQYELEMEQVVNYFNRSLIDKPGVEEALWSVAQQCIARLGWEDCVIYLLDEARGILVQTAAWGQKSAPGFQIVNPLEIPLGQGIVGAVAVSGNAELIADTTADSRYIIDDQSRGSELSVPIKAGDKVIGVIDSEHSQKGFYTSWHLQILTAIAALCSNKIALAQMEKAREEVRRQLEEKEKSLLEIEKRSAQIRLLALTNHLNPHFLFNSLTSLNSLIFENQQLASDFLQQLSKVYRYLLQHKEKETVLLKYELEFVQHYIFLLKTRFEDDIQIEMDIDYQMLEKGIVPVTLQILIENAVKHNVISQQNPLRIRVEAKNGILSVSNNIQRKKQVETSNRQGLESLRALYQYLSEQPLTVGEKDGAFIVTLPLIEK